MVRNLLIKGNAMMGKEVYLFNLPPVKTCTPTKWCLGRKDSKPNCYALRGNFIFPSVKQSARERYEASILDDFVDRMSLEIEKTDPKYFRFHASGDFYSEAYVKKIIEITKNFPGTLFRATTRRRDLTNIIRELNSLPNFIVRESLDTERRRPRMKLPFAAIDSLEIVQEADSYQCLDSCPKCDHYCWKNPVNMHFAQH